MEKYKYIGSMKANNLWDYTVEALLATWDVIDIILNHGKVDDAAKDKQPSDYDQDWCDHCDGYFLACYIADDGRKVYDLFQADGEEDEFFDRNGKEINVGDCVRWYDPDTKARDLSRVWSVYEVRGEIVCIADEFGEAEVYPFELELID